ncbi:MAG: M48 family metallopeptidase, partial [Burkholderiaceae bacterium]
MKRIALSSDQQLTLAFESPVVGRSEATRSADLAPNTRHAHAGTQTFAYQLRRARRRTIGFQIDDRGLTISAPRWVTLREIEAAIVEKSRWIDSRQRQWNEWKARRSLPNVHFGDGGTLPVLGAPITLRLQAETSETHFDQATSTLRLALPSEATEARVRDTVQAWLKAEAQRVFNSRFELFADRIDPRFAGWTVSSARSQWGSCTNDGRVRLSWRLIHF